MEVGKHSGRLHDQYHNHRADAAGRSVQHVQQHQKLMSVLFRFISDVRKRPGILFEAVVLVAVIYELIVRT